MKNHKAADMFSIYQIWLKSNVSKKSFADKHGITISTFYYWAKKFEAEKPAPRKPEVGFDRLNMESSHHATPTIAQAVIHFPSGIRLEWYGTGESVHLLKTLL